MRSGDDTIRAYVREVIREGMFWRRPGEKADKSRGKKRGFIDRVKSFFTGTGDVDEVVEEWIEDQEELYDIELSDETKKKILTSARAKYEKVLKRAKGDKEKALYTLKSSLNVKYRSKIQALSREARKREDAEDEDEDDDLTTR